MFQFVFLFDDKTSDDCPVDFVSYIANRLPARLIGMKDNILRRTDTSSTAKLIRNEL